MKNFKDNLKVLILFSCAFLTILACKDDDDQVFEETRLFRPVLNEDLYAIGNTIVVDIADLRRAESYILEVSRDSFATIEYTIQSDTSYVEINEALVGEELFYSALYQVRGQAIAPDTEFNSRVADFGSVRTERFPTILNIPASYDVTDKAARVTWTPLGADVTEIRVFAASDLRLTTPLFDPRPVTAAEAEAGEAIVEGLNPETEYQIAIYSGETLRGWVNYTTFVEDIDPMAPGVVDIRDQTDRGAVASAVSAAADGSIILLKRGEVYDLPTDDIDKNITIRAAYGFGEQMARLETTGNWDIASNVQLDHIRFINVEIRGEDYTGDYVFNPSGKTNTSVNQVLFEGCKIGRVRGVMRIRGELIINEITISNSIVDSVGNYGIFTADTNPADPGAPQTATFNNINLLNSTFNYITRGVQSRNNSVSITIDGCTFANFIETGTYMFRYRGGDGNDNVTNGISITNSIFGHSWDPSGEDSYGIQGINDGLESTNFSLVNNYSTANFFFTSDPIPGFPEGNYTNGQDNLWMDPSSNNFNFQDTGFPGRFDTGDPRWRVRL